MVSTDASLTLLRQGTVIPAHLLALNAQRQLDTQRQRALTRYYLDAGAGGVAVGVHSTQFAIREFGMYRPVLELAMATARQWEPLGGKRPLAMVAGLAGPTSQAVKEAELARDIGYHAGLLSLAAMRSASEDELLEHCRQVAGRLPLVGFYLQPAVGGRILSASFWEQFARIEQVVAIKIAPFHRYRTLDVVRGVVAAGAAARAASAAARASAHDATQRHSSGSAVRRSPRTQRPRASNQPTGPGSLPTRTVPSGSSS